MGTRTEFARIAETMELAKKGDERIDWRAQYVIDASILIAECTAMQVELRAAVKEALELRCRSGTGDLAIPGHLRFRMIDPDQFEFDRLPEQTPGAKFKLRGLGGVVRGAMRYPSGHEGLVVSVGKTDDLFTIPTAWFNALARKKRTGDGPSTGVDASSR